MCSKTRKRFLILKFKIRSESLLDLAGTRIFFVLSIIPNFAITKLLLGVFGLAWYAYISVTMLFGIALAMKLKYSFTAKFTACLIVAVFSVVTLLHVIFSNATIVEYQGFENFNNYLATCYNATNGVTVGGVFAGIFAFLFRNVF